MRIKSDKTILASLKEFAISNKSMGSISDGNGLSLLLKQGCSPIWKLRLYGGGKERVSSLGTYPNISLGDARKKAEVLRVTFRETGKTPSDLRPKPEAPPRKPRIDNFKAAALQWHQSSNAHLTQKHAAQILATLQQHVFPIIGHTKLDAITPGNILDDILQAMLNTEKPLVETASRVYQRIGAIYEWAGLHGLTQTNPAALCKREFARRKKMALRIAPATNFPAITNQVELQLLVNDLQRIPAETVRHAIWFIVYTACRSNEIRFARKTDFIDRLWRIPADRMKARREHLVPLSKQAYACYQQLVSRSAGSEFILRGRKDHQPVSDMTLSMALRRIGYEGRHTIHGFRATFSTLGREMGFRREAIEAQLAHVIQNSTEAAYMRSQFIEERRQMMQQWADYLDSLRASPTNH